MFRLSNWFIYELIPVSAGIAILIIYYGNHRDSRRVTFMTLGLASSHVSLHRARWPVVSIERLNAFIRFTIQTRN